MGFVDEITLKVSSGDGGRGRVSFSSARGVKGGPDGGDGGSGGSVILKVDPRKNSLDHFNSKKLYKAGFGQNGQPRKKKGKNGQSLILSVPAGTWLNVHNKQILFKKDQPYTLMEGGRGGKGNVHFTNSINQTPKKAGKGQKGKILSIHLEMKLKADTALLGLSPLYVKDFLLLSKKNKKYLNEYLFVQKSPRWLYSSYKMIEIPALLKNSDRFLKHIELCRVLIYLILYESEGQFKNDLQKVQKILKDFNPSFLKKKQIVYFPKDLSDQENFSVKIKNLQEFLKNKNAEPAQTAESLKRLMEKYVS